MEAVAPVTRGSGTGMDGRHRARRIGAPAGGAGRVAEPHLRAGKRDVGGDLPENAVALMSAMLATPSSVGIPACMGFSSRQDASRSRLSWVPYRRRGWRQGKARPRPVEPCGGCPPCPVCGYLRDGPSATVRDRLPRRPAEPDFGTVGTSRRPYTPASDGIQEVGSSTLLGSISPFARPDRYLALAQLNHGLGSVRGWP